MDDTFKSLTRWKRQTKQKVHSRSHRVTSTDDIQDWIKKVEEASSKATDATFGLASLGKQRGRAAVELRTELVRDHEQAYSEAKELLTQWINEKVRFDEEDGFDDLEAWRRARESKRDASKTQSDVDEDFSLERLKNLVLEDDFEIDEAAIYERVKRNALGDADPYANLFEMEENDAVNAVLQNMLSKEIVRETFNGGHDPRTKMELRHTLVKENREKRQKEEERRKMEAQMKKEARLKAQQLILKEQKDRETRARKEEMKLKKEMAKIRKEMHDEKMHKIEELRKAREEKELMDKLAREEFERQMAAEEKEMMESKRIENDMRKKRRINEELVKAKIASKNLQCLHRHFAAWYDLILSKHLLIAKVKAMSDWKLLLRVWGAWRSHVRGRRLEFEAVIHERNLVDTERKRLTAERHHAQSLLRRCFVAWHQFVIESLERKEMKKEQQRTRSKMMSLLSALAEGKMWKDEDEAEGPQTHGSSASRRASSVMQLQQATDSQKVEQMFQRPIRKQAWVHDDKSVQSSHSETAVNVASSANGSKSPLKSMGKSKSHPTQPWQLTKQHVKLTKGEISNAPEQECGCYQRQQAHTNAEIRKKFGTQPWMNRRFTVNNLEHRYTAQQQALKEQQNQIREQKRLIEELQYEQRQQVLKQQLLIGANGPVLPPLAESEVPPPGKQIPRGDNDRAKNKGDNSDNQTLDYSNTSADVTNTRVTVEHPTKDGVEAERSDLETWRTEQSSAASTTITCSSVAKPQNTRYLQVLKNFEERAAERARLKAEREERRKIQELEKLAQVQKQEEEAVRALEAEKKLKAEAYRQKKRLEKQKEEEKRKELSRLEELNKMANEHYLRSILKYRGLLPFKKIISLAKRNWAVAVRHRDREVMRQCLRAWKKFAEEKAMEKNSMADQMHQFLVIKHSFQRWKNYKYHMRFLEKRAKRQYQDNLRCRFFQAWVDWVEVEREETLRKVKAAHSHHLRNLIRKVFMSWRHLPDMLKREEERRKRKTELRQKVTELIPDFAPEESVTINNSEDLS